MHELTRSGPRFSLWGPRIGRHMSDCWGLFDCSGVKGRDGTVTLVAGHQHRETDMSMRKMLLCSGAALLAFFSSAALAVQPLEVRSVNVDFETNQIFIHGVNFLNGNDLEISLSDIGEINSVDVTSTLIVANFPVSRTTGWKLPADGLDWGWLGTLRRDGYHSGRGWSRGIAG